jgi:Pyridoxamine 5'-phosphate oxidase
VDKQELENELGQDGARALLENGTLLRIAYNGRDGLPRAIPIGFLWNGEEIVVCTAVTSPKAHALRERPDVALTIDVGATSTDAKSLLVRGTAKVVTVNGVPPEYLAAARKSLDEQQAAAFESEVTNTFDEMARISIIPTWARYFDFGGGRVPKFLRDLAEGA